jgi:hypothetical protein
MKPKLAAILDRAIEQGIKRGYQLAHKHTAAPSADWVQGCINDAIWLEIDEVLDFESDPCD